MLQIFFPLPLNQQGSPCCGSLMWLKGRYNSKVNLIGPLDWERFAAEMLLYVFNIGFPESLLIDDLDPDMDVFLFLDVAK